MEQTTALPFPSSTGTAAPIRAPLVALPAPEPPLVAVWRALGMGVAESPDYLQFIIDCPAVRAAMGRSGSEFVRVDADTLHRGVGFEFDGCAMVAQDLGDLTCELHAYFVPGARPEAVERARLEAAAAVVFLMTRQMRISLRMSSKNPEGCRLAELAGFRFEYERPVAFGAADNAGASETVRHYALAFDEWMRARSPVWVREQCRLLGQEQKGWRATIRWALTNDDPDVLIGDRIQ